MHRLVHGVDILVLGRGSLPRGTQVVVARRPVCRDAEISPRGRLGLEVAPRHRHRDAEEHLLGHVLGIALADDARRLVGDPPDVLVEEVLERIKSAVHLLLDLDRNEPSFFVLKSTAIEKSDEAEARAAGHARRLPHLDEPLGAERGTDPDDRARAGEQHWQVAEDAEREAGNVGQGHLHAEPRAEGGPELVRARRRSGGAAVHMERPHLERGAPEERAKANVPMRAGREHARGQEVPTSTTAGVISTATYDAPRGLKSPPTDTERNNFEATGHAAPPSMLITAATPAGDIGDIPNPTPPLAAIRAFHRRVDADGGASGGGLAGGGSRGSNGRSGGAGGRGEGGGGGGGGGSAGAGRGAGGAQGGLKRSPTMTPISSTIMSHTASGVNGRVHTGSPASSYTTAVAV